METQTEQRRFRVIPKPPVVLRFQLVRLKNDLMLGSDLLAEKGAVGIVTCANSIMMIVDFDTDHNHDHGIYVAGDNNVEGERQYVWCVMPTEVEFLEDIE